MSNNNWRNMRWRDMSGTSKLWFFLMCLLLFILFIGIILDCIGLLNIPNWVALIWVIASGYTAYRNIICNNLFSDTFTDEDNDKIDSHTEDK